MLNPDSSQESPSSSITKEVKYTGVRKRKWGMHVSEIRIPNSRERIWLGSYDTAEQAARAFDAALFCLRGPNAKFNFPEDPPMIPGGQSLGPVDIQRVAQEYAFIGIIIQPPLTTNNGGVGDVSEVNAELIGNDWSSLNDWDMYGSPLGGNTSDFGYFPDTGQMYLPSNYASNEDESGCIGASFLWSF